MDLTPVKTKRLFEEIVEQIKQLITGGELKPGDRLLGERELAEKLEVSRASVREAIRALEMLGVVDIRPGDGTFVRDTNTDDIIRPLAMFLAIERNSLLEMFEVRRVFEAATARLAAERATKEEIEQLSEVLEKTKQALVLVDPHQIDPQDPLGEELDKAFHYALAEATHNSLLTKLFRTVSEEFGKAIAVARRMLMRARTNAAINILDQHTRILEAIKARDPEAAARAVLEHLNYVEKELRARMP